MPRVSTRPDPTGVARSLFDRFDADGNHSIDAAELKALCASLGRELSEEQARETLQAAQRGSFLPEGFKFGLSDDNNTSDFKGTLSATTSVLKP